ncbi:MAG: thioredoxin family protein [Anaerolineae bacterium]
MAGTHCVTIRVFTHPVCTGCSTAIRMAQKLSDQRDDVEMQVISLASARGREEAKAEGVLSVPTVFVGPTRFVGVPPWDELLAAVNGGGPMDS